MSLCGSSNCPTLYALISLSLLTLTIPAIMKWIVLDSMPHTYPLPSFKMVTNNTNGFNIYHFNESDKTAQGRHIRHMLSMHEIQENERQFFHLSESSLNLTEDELLRMKLLCLRDIKISVLGDSTAFKTHDELTDMLDCEAIDREDMSLDGYLPEIEYFSNFGNCFYYTYN